MLGFVNKLFISVQLIFFLDHVLLLAELAQKFKFFKIAVWRSDSMKRNFGNQTKSVVIIWVDWWQTSYIDLTKNNLYFMNFSKITCENAFWLKQKYSLQKELCLIVPAISLGLNPCVRLSVRTSEWTKSKNSFGQFFSLTKHCTCTLTGF